MDLRNCKSCGRVFAYRGSDVCSRCDKGEEEDFKKVKEYLYDYPGSTIREVAEATEVSDKKILKFLRESRIEIREANNFLLDCERCGASIQFGRFCSKCVMELKRDFNSVTKPKDKETSKLKSTRVHAIERRKNNK